MEYAQPSLIQTLLIISPGLLFLVAGIAKELIEKRQRHRKFY